MSDKAFVGRSCATVSKPPALEPIRKIVLWVDDSNCYEAGDSTGREIEVTCPYGTQTMAEDLLRRLSGYAYRPFSATDALLDGAAELGDAVTVDGCYTLLANVDFTFDSLLTGEIAAPGAAELEQEYSFTDAEQMLSHKLAQTRSLITKTSEQIRLEVSNEIQQLSSSIQISLDSIEAKVSDNARGLSQTVRLAADGLTITNASGSRLTIDGGQIKAASIETSAFKANSITADKLNITGAITFGDLDSSTQSTINSAQSTATNANYNANNAYVLANNAYNLALNNTPPSYIKSTYIDSVSIQSPTIMGGTFIGNTFNVISETGGGSFNLYGTYGGRSVHALTISYGEGTAPLTSFYSPSGGYASWDFTVTYWNGSISLGSGDISFNAGGVITSLREMYQRLIALGG